MSDPVPVRVPVEPMTAEAFAPYGIVFGAELPMRDRVDRPLAFSHRGSVTLGTISQPAGGTGFTRMERHLAVTQAFVQLSGSPSVVCVAPPTHDSAADPAGDVTVVPAPEQVRGFLIDPDLGFQFHVGTWHSLDRFVLHPPGATFLIVNVKPNPTQIVDYASGELTMHADLGASRAEPRGHGAYRDVSFQLAL